MWVLCGFVSAVDIAAKMTPRTSLQKANEYVGTKSYYYILFKNKNKNTTVKRKVSNCIAILCKVGDKNIDLCISIIAL